MYEIIYTQQKENKGRVVHKNFNDYDVARCFAHDLIMEDNTVVQCSIYKNGFLIMDIL